MDKWDVKCAKMDNLGELFSISSRCLCIVDLCNLRMFIFGPFSFDILLHFYAINTSMLFETKCKPKESVWGWGGDIKLFMVIAILKRL